MEFKNKEYGKIMYIDYLGRLLNYFGEYKIEMFLPSFKYLKIVKYKKGWYNKFGLHKYEIICDKDFDNLDDIIEYIFKINNESFNEHIYKYEKWYHNFFTNEIKMY